MEGYSRAMLDEKDQSSEHRRLERWGGVDLDPPLKRWPLVVFTILVVVSILILIFLAVDLMSPHMERLAAVGRSVACAWDALIGSK